MHFFIHRPIFATVLSVVITIVGTVSINRLPIELYPDVAPPVVSVTTTYPGAGSKVISETTATPIEQQVVGVDNMLYMSSQCDNSGAMTLNVSFELGTDPNLNQVLVQNRVSQALPQLPDEVRRQGVTTAKKSPSILLAVNLVSPKGTYNQLYLSNYATIQVKDELSRLPGVGSVTMLGQRDYAMRLWLDPQLLASRNLTTAEVVQAVRAQNVQVAAGQFGQPPAAQGLDFQYTISAMGRLVEKDQFEDIIVKIGEGGRLTRLGEVARVELGAADYSVNSYLNGQPSAMLAIFQLPGSNALDVANAVRKKMSELSERFPTDLQYEIVYDTTEFITVSINEVVHTLFEAVLLVFLVVFVFLQNWRATLIPTLAIPVSIVGTFFAMAILGFSINTLTLFGLVLAIGIVVDDAIVVVENVERNLEQGLSPVQATEQAVDEVAGPVIATALVLAAVFVPCMFISGISGQFFRQFAITITVSTIISAFVSLTFTPALCAIFLRGHHAPPDIFTRFLNQILGWFFRAFNRLFATMTTLYGHGVGWLIRGSVFSLLLFGGLLLIAYWSFIRTPTGFVPSADQGYFIVQLQLPDASSLERTDAVTRRVADMLKEREGVAHTIAIPGYSLAMSVNSYNTGTVIVVMTHWRERDKPGLYVDQIIQSVMADLAGVPEAFGAAFNAPPIQGIGQAGGFKMQVQDRGDTGLEALQQAVNEVIEVGRDRPEVLGLFTTFRANQPQQFADVDRTKVQTMGVQLSDVFETMQTYLGSLYVNDFNRFGRTYRVYAQADTPYRTGPQALELIRVRNAEGKMVPLDTVVTLKEITGPERVNRYNMYPTAEINGAPAPGYSTGQAIRVMEALAKEKLPGTMTFEWTDLAFQETRPGTPTLVIFGFSALFVFLTLAAQYESWLIPLAVILVVPLGLLGAMLGILLRGMDSNIFTQIGLVLLVGLGSKNAILMVEFARSKRGEGLSRFDAAVQAAKLRLRPILMTAFAFILGVVPLVIAKGAGAESRQTLGTAVFSGMVMLSLVGIFFTPVFYVIAQWISDRGRDAMPSAGPDDAHSR